MKNTNQETTTMTTTMSHYEQRLLMFGAPNSVQRDLIASAAAADLPAAAIGYASDLLSKSASRSVLADRLHRIERYIPGFAERWLRA